MTRARDVSRLITTPPNIYATDSESSSGFLSLSSASSIYQGAPFRNLIINGAMQVAQRGTSVASITTTGYYTADRWKTEMSSLGTWTHSVENDGPTGSGFTKSFKMLCTTADASPAAGDYKLFYQVIEGQNLQQVKKGTAAAEQLTFSFWVKSNVTGTYIVELYDQDNTRSISRSYTINASGTWERKTITFPADTTGAFDNDNNGSLVVQWAIGLGSTFTSGTLQTTWGTPTSANRFAGQTNLASATNNYWQITGVQLEVGPVATPFEFKPFAQDYAECQRYYQKTFAPAVTPGNNVGYSGGLIGKGNNAGAAEPFLAWTFRVSMRDYPDVTTYNLGSGTTGQWSNGAGTVGAHARVVAVSPEGVSIDNSGIQLTANTQYYIQARAISEL